MNPLHEYERDLRTAKAAGIFVATLWVLIFGAIGLFSLGLI